MKAVCVAGARPNFMKIKPVLDSLESRGADTTLVHTGQHYDTTMSDVFFADLGIRSPDRHLNVGSGTHAEQTGRVMTAFEPLLEETRPDVVVVVGDVNSTMACAIVGAKHGCLVAHVESGLRSRDWSMPEEINRVVTDRVSDLLFAPSPDAVDNLTADGYRDDQIHLVGNVMVDTLLANVDRASQLPVHNELNVEPDRYALVTLHRPANVDDPHVLAGLMAALNEIAAGLPIVFPVHPRTRRQLSEMPLHPQLLLVDPLGYLGFIALEARARIVLTDSGGIQEETTVLGIPCLTLRDNTERPITVTEGTNRVVGRDPARILSEARNVLRDPPPPRRPALWDGKAGGRIASVLLESVARPPLRPTDSARDETTIALVARSDTRRQIDLSRAVAEPLTAATSYRITELRDVVVDGESHTLLFKELGDDSLFAAARNKPRGVLDPDREPTVYSEILRDRMGVPLCIGTLHEPDAGRSGVLIEKVPGVELWQIGDLRAWVEVARWLARFHEARLDRELAPAVLDRLLTYDASFYAEWPERALRFAGPAQREAIASLDRRHEALVARLESLPRRFIHGEFFASNILVVTGPDTTRVAPIDWEMSGIGPAVLDLAALIEGWRDAEQRILIAAYRNALRQEPSDRHPDPETFAELVDCARLHLCLRWLGWAADWKPPAEHRRDWLGTALELAARLDL